MFAHGESLGTRIIISCNLSKLKVGAKQAMKCIASYFLFAFTDHEGFPLGLKTDFTLPKEEEEEEEEEQLPKSKL